MEPTKHIHFEIVLKPFRTFESYPVVMITGDIEYEFMEIIMGTIVNHIEMNDTTSQTSVKIDHQGYLPLLERLNGDSRISKSYELHVIPRPIFNTIVKRWKSKPDVSTLHKEAFPTKTWNALKRYQKEGIASIVENNGRLLLADGMGMGKSLQAIGMMMQYSYQRPDFVTYIICDKSNMANWRLEILKWTWFTNNDIQLVKTGKDVISPYKKIVLITYGIAKKRFVSTRISPSDSRLTKLDGYGPKDMITFTKDKGQKKPSYVLSKKDDSIKVYKPNLCIVDESQALKSESSIVSLVLTKFLLAITRVVLMTGTPQLSKPCELYNQMLIVFGFKIIGTWKEFTLRYCNGHQDERMGNSFWDATGKSHIDELSLLLHTKMVRRSKELLGLPPIFREIVKMDIPKEGIKTMNDFRSEMELLQKTSAKFKGKLWSVYLQKMKTLKMEMWRATGPIKAGSVKLWLTERLKQPGKFLVFAHHHEMHNILSEFLEEHEVNFVKITGATTKTETRQMFVEAIADPESDVQVALLSLDACSTALNFSPGAVEVVFAELPWTPTKALQAEARVNRLTTTAASVKATYLLGKHTVDEQLHLKLIDKFKTFDRIVDKGENKHGFDAHGTKRLKLENNKPTTDDNHTLDEYFHSGK